MFFENLSDDEISACVDLVEKMRAEKRKKEVIGYHREALQSAVISTIDAIGLEETKRIIREINRNLRGED